MNSKNIKSFSNAELLNQLKSHVQEERRVTLEVLHFLREVEARRLPAEMAFSSLHEFCIKELGYTSGAAHRRIESMRLLREVPSAEEKILSGELNLTVLSQVQTFARHERKVSARSVSAEEKQGLLEKFCGKSVREVERELIARAPKMARRFQEGKRAVSETETALRIVADAELLELIDAVRAYGSPGESLMTTFKRMARGYLDRRAPSRAPKRMPKPAPAPGSPQASSSQPKRYISKAHAHAVRTRAENRCEWRHGPSRRRCEARAALQMDHIVSFSKGGPSTQANLQLLCPTHNRHKAVQEFGEEKMRGETER